MSVYILSFSYRMKILWDRNDDFIKILSCCRIIFYYVNCHKLLVHDGLRAFILLNLYFRRHRSTMYVNEAYCYRRSSVGYLSVGHMSVTIVSPAKTAEPIDMPFGLWTQVGPTMH